MKKKTQSSEWLKSKEVMKMLKIRARDVMHLREAEKKNLPNKETLFYILPKVLLCFKIKVKLIV